MWAKALVKAVLKCLLNCTPGERHEEGEGARDGDDEAVLDVARVRHLLQGDPGQVRLVAPALQRDYRVLQHVLKFR